MVSVTDYISTFPKDVQNKLLILRQLILEIAPQAKEIISYGIPTYKLKKNLVHFGAYKNHIGFYPTPVAIIKFKKELVKYVTSKGAIQFPLDKPLPINLIKRIIIYRIKELN